jgi:hypothetical protein
MESNETYDTQREHKLILRKQYKSVMRRSIANEIDRQTKRTRIEKIISRRGAFKWLPVAFSNDLVHGSWWYLIGSAFGIIFPMMIIVANHSPNMQVFAYDDDLLRDVTIDTTWILMIVSSVFFTLGSGAFLRAVNDPPMKPYFSSNFYHISTDELLGSWLFLFACFPFVPYSLIFVIAEPSNIFYWCMLSGALISVFGSYIFLVNCYPSEIDREATILPWIQLCNCYSLNCFCTDAFIARHLSNDWLAATWIIYYVTLFGSLISFVIFAESLFSHAPLRIFIDGCTYVLFYLFCVTEILYV